MSGWTEDRDTRLLELFAEGYTGGEIAEALGGVSRNAVIGRINRLRAAGDPRAPAGRPNPVQARRREMDRLADAFADGAANIADAARHAGLHVKRATELWAAIKAGLGPQAT